MINSSDRTQVLNSWQKFSQMDVHERNELRRRNRRRSTIKSASAKGTVRVTMLESNTDRSYFTIGAVIVAAILIAGATYIFRDVLFAPLDASGNGGYIPELINGVFSKADTLVDGISTDSQTK